MNFFYLFAPAIIPHTPYWGLILSMNFFYLFAPAIIPHTPYWGLIIIPHTPYWGLILSMKFFYTFTPAIIPHTPSRGPILSIHFLPFYTSGKSEVCRASNSFFFFSAFAFARSSFRILDRMDLSWVLLS